MTRPAPGLPLDTRVREFLEKDHWYHTIEIAGVRTSGVIDHRPWLPRYGFPEDLTGKTVLDVGTGDGFFAFERRTQRQPRVSVQVHITPARRRVKQ